MDEDKTTQQPKITPQTPSGTIPVAGTEVPISAGTIPASPPNFQQPTEVIKGLKEASDTGVFPAPLENVNDDPR